MVHFLLDRPLRSTRLGGWDLERNAGPRELHSQLPLLSLPFQTILASRKAGQASDPESRGQVPAALGLESQRLHSWITVPM